MADPIHVVVVDDEPGLAADTADALEGADGRLHARPAAAPDEPLDVLGGTSVDCVVSEYAMSPTDGLDLLRAVRERHPSLPFVLYTDGGSEAVASEAVSAGVTAYLRRADDGNAALAGRIVEAVERSREEADARRLQGLSAAFPDIVFHFDAEGRYLDVLTGSDNLLFSRDEADLVGKRFHDVHPDHLADRFLETVRLALDTGETQSVDYRFERDGVRWYEARVVPLSSTSSTERSVLWAARDITAREGQERVLEQYRSLVDAMQDPVCIYDEDGRYEVVNEHLAEAYGTTPEDIRGRESGLVRYIREGADGDPYQELLAGESDELKGEYESPIPGHGTFEFRLTRFVIDGRCEGAVAVSRDVTERKARQRELQRTNARLEEFASIVSHDLRNPLNVAVGRLALAREERESEDLAEAEVALGRMESLIADLLTLAREGDRVGDLGPVDLGEVTETCWRNVATGGTTLVSRTERTILADGGSLQQLLENLFRNAIEHGGGDVTVEVGDLDGGFYVADDGSGLPGPGADRLFESGFSTTDGGTGFGLSIVEGIAEAHGWRVRATDADGGGARFEVTGVEFA